MINVAFNGCEQFNIDTNIMIIVIRRSVDVLLMLRTHTHTCEENAFRTNVPVHSEVKMLLMAG